jgi:orotate phosphoribosyltransferase
MAVEANPLLRRLEAVGALKRGHFRLASGNHSDQYVEKFDLLRRPGDTSAVCAEIAERYRGAALDVVVGPTTGGVLLAFEVARQLGIGAAYAERRSDGSSGRAFRAGTSFAPGQRVLVVDDILTTGGSVRETLAALDQEPVEVVGIAVLVDRSGGAVDFGVPLSALATLRIETWPAAACPLCADATPLVQLGTTAQPAVGDGAQG